MWMNEWDIEEAAREFDRHAVLGPASRFLAAFCHEVNAHSDGWPYWRQPAHAAAKLMNLLQAHRRPTWPAPPAPTEADVRKALAPIKAFMTRRGTAAGMTLPELR